MSQIKKKFISNDAVDQTKVRLDNDAALRARNAADTADVEILKVNASDRVEFASVPQSTVDASAGNDLVRYSQVTPIAEDVADLVTLSGVAANSTDLGTFTGDIIPDASDVKEALQSLETAIEALPEPLVYKGTYNASTNTPALANTDTGKLGFLYQVTVAGTQDFGAGNISFEVGDKVVNNGTIWEKWDMTDAVSSVNGQTGAVSLALDDLSDVNAAAPADGEVLTYDSGTGEWVSAALPPGNTYSGGDMITLTADVFSVDLAATSGLESTNPGNAAGQLRVKLEAANPSLQITGSNELAAKLDAAGAVVSNASGLAVQVDDASIEIALNTVQIKDAGVTLSKIADDAVDENKIVASAISTTGALNGGSGAQLAVRVDNITVKTSATNELESLKHREEIITLTATDITNQYVDLASEAFGTSATVNSVSLTPVGGILQLKGVDYSVSLTGGSGGVTRITFEGELATAGAAELVDGDILIISYDFLN